MADFAVCRGDVSLVCMTEKEYKVKTMHKAGLGKEGENRAACVFIKSFKNTAEPLKTGFIMSVVVTIEDTKVVISTYKRKRREVLSKIKKAGVIAYEKGYGTSQTNGI